MKPAYRSGRNRWLLLTGLALLVLAAVGWPQLGGEPALADASVVSGYSLFSVLVILALFRVRKRLIIIPLGNARIWISIHLVGGLLALALFVVHIDGFWPAAGYEQWLAGLLYVTAVTGLLGFIIQKIYPRRLTETGDEILYERIPAAIAEIRQAAEQLLLQSTAKEHADTLAQHYADRLGWFFRQPRFVVSHLFGGRRAQHWLQLQFDFLEHYLQNSEQISSAKLRALADKKLSVDFHFAAQRLLKAWLLVHVPVSAALVMLALWHLLLVNIYVL